MKKTVLAAGGGLLALGVLCYVGSLWAQQQPNPAQPAQAAAAPPRTRIALLNLTFVIKNYEKYKHFQSDLKAVMAPFMGTEENLRQEAETLRKTYEEAAKKGQPIPQAEYERKVKDLQRRKEDNDAEAKMMIGKKSDEEMKILYLDVVRAAQGYAASHDFDLVLHYNDATSPEDYLSVQNIARKLNAGALMPLYAAAGMDISQNVVELLNYNLRPTTQGGAPAPTAGAAGAGGGTH